VTVKVDMKGNPVLDEKGYPIFIEKSGMQVNVSRMLPNELKMHSKVITKEVKQNYIFRDGRKVEVMQSANGQYYF
jgi:hypothetical protein